VGQVRAYGNAINQEVAAEFVAAYLAALSETAHRTAAPLIERLPPNTSEAA
jgi:hypothetical protein